MKAIKFPEDFTKISHSVIPGAYQYLYKYNDDCNNVVSIVGGGLGLRGDGVNTFEMWDTKHMYDPAGYMSIDDINEWLSTPHKEIKQESE